MAHRVALRAAAFLSASHAPLDHPSGHPGRHPRHPALRARAGRVRERRTRGAGHARSCEAHAVLQPAQGVRFDLRTG